MPRKQGVTQRRGSKPELIPDVHILWTSYERTMTQAYIKCKVDETSRHPDYIYIYIYIYTLYGLSLRWEFCFPSSAEKADVDIHLISTELMLASTLNYYM